MTERTRKILKKWGARLKKSIHKLGESHISLNHLEASLAHGDAVGAIGELQRLRKMRKKLKKKA